MKDYILIFSIAYLLLAACSSSDDKEISIACASNVQFAMEELVETFELKTGYRCRVILGSSGKLTAQILAGAPYDIFVSANLKYPTTIFEKGKTIEAPKIYGYGSLVLWSSQEIKGIDLDLTKSLSVKHIAIANPQIAPYGRAAEEYLKNREIYAEIESKLVFGESISQVNQFVISGAADLGFTAKSVVLSPEMEKKGSWMECDKSDYSPISQGAVILKRSASKAAAQAFYNHLFSEEASSILVKYGYEVDL